MQISTRVGAVQAMECFPFLDQYYRQVLPYSGRVQAQEIRIIAFVYDAGLWLHTDLASSPKLHGWTGAPRKDLPFGFPTLAAWFQRRQWEATETGTTLRLIP
jgi:hypothetical protein